MPTAASPAPARSSCPRPARRPDPPALAVPVAPVPAAPAPAAPALRLAAPTGSSRAPSTSAASPTGTFTRKIIRHPVPNTSAPISPPDAIGPSMADRPITGP